ncbi:hypothetical protein [Streptomyces sp. NBC_00154]|uniref:hypothetical protein n=1 Tax=Streptomyces sp. NBC_00154 TaxID=2975670 RepID=UPI002251F724|nr:hypothetical protein [Streptomyces sp. NBC_00154]MCX5316046.1 hypothetical protein [Streptomyces sp. NBC_00154]
MTTVSTPPAPGTNRAEETVRPTGTEPIYTALAAEWAAAGRLIPGQRDHEWTRLTTRSPRPGR